MGKETPTKPDAAAPTSSAATAVAQAPARPRLGEPVTVKVAPGLALLNNETGRHFEADAATVVITTVTLLRRLDDGDLVLA